MGEVAEGGTHQPSHADGEPECDSGGGAGPRGQIVPAEGHLQGKRYVERDRGRCHEQVDTGARGPHHPRDRLHHALILLAEKTPFTAVAHRCGWASASAFIDIFRKTFGHTPRAHPGDPPPSST
ncbi:helix-turn-helix domain-containing protein [Nocardia flavorosea]|uniref:Helix-turn-helix domain-containing protein n=1 Tax=Nocardia flavorosea TaxID=53429 RepID=A0A846YIT3_9NOCA|nr:helix-turn-helix domain-containing protein [Nocardia flavorosea]